GGELAGGEGEIRSLGRQRSLDDAQAAWTAATREVARTASATADNAVIERRFEPQGLASILSGSMVIDQAGGRGDSDRRVLVAPAGRFFDGLAVEARGYPAVAHGRIVTAVPPGFVDDQFLRRSRRALVVGVTDDPSGWRAFGLDSREARRRLMKGGPRARLLMPPAYALDDLTLGLMWAVANLDEALLNDDGLLAELQGELARYEALPHSAAARDMASDLTAVSQMWLGSDFCARHLLPHLPDA